MASILSIEPETLAGSIAASRLSVLSPRPGSLAVKAATSFDTVPSRASVASMLSRLACRLAATPDTASTVVRTRSGSTAAVSVSIRSSVPDTFAGSMAATSASVFSPSAGRRWLKPSTFSAIVLARPTMAPISSERAASVFVVRVTLSMVARTCAGSTAAMTESTLSSVEPTLAGSIAAAIASILSSVAPTRSGSMAAISASALAPSSGRRCEKLSTLAAT